MAVHAQSNCILITKAEKTALLGGHFVYKSSTSTSGLTLPSANVIQNVQYNGADVTNDPTKWGYNVNIGSTGIKLRNNETDLSSWTSTALTFYNPSDHTAQLTIGANGALQSGNFVYRTDLAEKRFSQAGTKIDLTNGDIITPNFRLASSGTLDYDAGAYIHGTIEAIDGYVQKLYIGTNTTNRWEVGNFTNYDQSSSAALISNGTAFIQLGKNKTWRLSTDRIHTAWIGDNSTALTFPIYDNKYWDWGIHSPHQDEGIWKDKFLYIRNATYDSENPQAAALAQDLDDNLGLWTYQFWVDRNGNVHAPGFYIGNSSTPIGGGAGTVAEKLLTGAGSGINPVYFRTDTGHVGELAASTSTVGGTTQPIYMNSGTLTALGYTIETSVPANALFTDTDTKVTQTPASDNNNYEILLSATADNNTHTEEAKKTNTLTYNPSTGALVTNGTINGYTLAAASEKGVVTDFTNNTSSTDLPTTAAVATYVDKGDTKIPFGQVDSTSTATVFTATIPGITELVDGVCVYLRNGVITSASGFTININNLGAKPVYSTLAAASRATTLFNINYTMLFVYNSSRVSGGCWDCFYGYDSNTNTIGYQVRTNSMSMPMKSITYRYRLLFTAADGEHWVPANNSTSTNATAIRTVCQDKINPFGDIRYYGTTASVAAGSRPGAGYLWQQYNITLGYSFNNTGVALALTSWEPVYLKCEPQSDGSAIIDSTTPYVQALPSTEDGKIYIFLGVATAETTMELTLEHPVYEYRNGKVQPYISDAKTVNGHVVASDVPSNAIFTDTVTTVTVSGSGNAITEMSASNGAITAEKNSTFLLTSDIAGWAKAVSKPSYNFSEINNKPTTISGYGITDAYTKTEIDGLVSGALHYKGTQSTVSDLENISSPATGDVWHITADGSEWAWDGSEWQELGSVVDLSNYVTTDDSRLSDARTPLAHSHSLSTITNADDLQAIEALSGTNGFLVKTAANSWALDTNTYLTSHQDVSGKADKTTTVTNVAYDSTNNKITKTINGQTSDVVTVATLKTALTLTKSDVGLSDVTNDEQVPKSIFDDAYQLLYSTAANTPAVLNPNISSTKKFLRMTGTGSIGAAPAWDTVSKSDVGLSNVTNYSQITKIGDSGDGKLRVWTGDPDGNNYTDVTVHITAYDQSTVAKAEALDLAAAVGTNKKPVYFKADGKPYAIDHTIETNVPAGAVFTDTTYTFANGTNGFTVTPSGGSAQTVTVTPSIANNVTGSGTSGYLAKWNGTNTITNGPQFTSGGAGFLKEDGTWATPGGTYSLPIAKYNVLGGVKPLFSWTNAVSKTTALITSAAPTINDRQTTAGRYYAIEADSNGVLFVNVPWENTTYTIPTVTQSATTGISIADHSTTTIYGVSSNTTSVTGVSGSTSVYGVKSGTNSTTTASHVVSGGNGTAPSWVFEEISIPNVTAAGSGSFTQGSFYGGSFEQGTDTFVANTPTAIDTSKFSGGSFTRGTFSHTHNPATHGTDTHTHVAATLTFTMDTTDPKMLKIAFNGGSGSFTQGAFNGGSGSASHGNDTFTAASFQSGFYTAGTAASFTQGEDSFNPATHGNDVHTHVAPTLGTAKKVQSKKSGSNGSASTWAFEDITVPIRADSATTVPTAASSATTVPIKNSSSTTVVTSKTHSVTDNGHTHTI